MFQTLVDRYAAARHRRKINLLVVPTLVLLVFTLTAGLAVARTRTPTASTPILRGGGWGQILVAQLPPAVTVVGDEPLTPNPASSFGLAVFGAIPVFVGDGKQVLIRVTAILALDGDMGAWTNCGLSHPAYEFLGRTSVQIDGATAFVVNPDESSGRAEAGALMLLAPGRHLVEYGMFVRPAQTAGTCPEATTEFTLRAPVNLVVERVQVS